MSALDLLRDVLDTAHASDTCPCGTLAHVALREDSEALLSALTELVRPLAQSNGDGLRHALVVILATGYALGAES